MNEFNKAINKLKKDLIKIIIFSELYGRLDELQELHNKEIKELGGYDE